MDLAALIEKKRQTIEAALLRYLPQDTHSLSEAMRYSVLAGGKRLRPILALLSYEASGGKEVSEILPAACALEYVHTFTLIHDDLPAMDNDDLRRGKPTSHKMFGEGMAVLAGDALMIDGLGLMTKSTASPELVVRAAAGFTSILGSNGITRGQADDLYAAQFNPKSLRHIHYHKTALFMAFAVWVGAELAGVGEDLLSAARRAGIFAGMGFQIRDDILDVISSREDLGKTPGKDEIEHKLTYPALYGLEGARRIAHAYARRASSIFTSLGEKWAPLVELTQELVTRTK